MIVVDKTTFDVFIEQKRSIYGDITTSEYKEDGMLERITCYVDGFQVIAVETRMLQTDEIIYEINDLDQQTVF
jgi:hypothetical protein